MTQEPWFPHVTVATIVSRDGKYLMVEENSQANGTVINQPAGHVEAGESIQQAALRETLEEACWQVELEYLVGVYHWTSPGGKTYIRFAFAASPESDLTSKTARDTDIHAVHWLSREEIGTKFMPRSPLVMQCIQDFEQKQAYPLDLIQTLEIA